MKELLQKYKKALLSGAVCLVLALALARSEEHTSELQSP